MDVFEADRPNSDFYTVYNGVWIVVNAQATIGYGEFTPETYFGCIVLLISCFVCTFLLSLIVALSSCSLSLTLAESSLYTAVAYRDFVCAHRREAAVLLQRWWRLIGMRLHRTISGPVILNYYGELGRYRKVLQAGEQTKDRRFEGQFEAFQVHIAPNRRAMSTVPNPRKALLVAMSNAKLPFCGFSTRQGVLVGESGMALPHSGSGETVKTRPRLLGRLLKELDRGREVQSLSETWKQGWSVLG